MVATTHTILEYKTHKILYLLINRLSVNRRASNFTVCAGGRPAVGLNFVKKCRQIQYLCRLLHSNTVGWIMYRGGVTASNEESTNVCLSLSVQDVVMTFLDRRRMRLSSRSTNQAVCNVCM